MAGAPSKYNAKYHDPWAFSLACDGHTDAEIADAMDINERTLNRWKFVHEKIVTPVFDKKGSPILDKNGKQLTKTQLKPVLDENGDKCLTPFGEELFKGKSVADAQVEQSLFKSCFGYTVEEKEEIVEVGSDGRPKPLKVKKTTRFVEPVTTAQIYWLKNRKPKQWRDKREIIAEVTDNVIRNMQTIADLINHPVPDVSIEDIIAEAEQSGDMDA